MHTTADTSAHRWAAQYTLRASDQIRALIVAHSSPFGRKPPHQPPSPSDYGPSPARSAVISENNTLAREGHVVGRLMWELVRDTARTFVIQVNGGSRLAFGRPGGCVCLRVSPVLAGVVGVVEGRWSGAAGYRFNWNADRSACSIVPEKWQLCGGGNPEEMSVVRVIEHPEEGIPGRCAVNSKWLVTCGEFSDGKGGRQLMMVTQRLMRLVSNSARGYHRCGEEVASVALSPHAVDSKSVFIMQFSQTGVDELLLTVLEQHEKITPSILVVDVESTHSTGSLSVISVTRVDVESSYAFSYLLPMRKQDGSRTFITEGSTLAHYVPESLSLEVQETSGTTRRLPDKQYCQLNDSEYFIGGSNADGHVPIWNCNNTNNPEAISKVLCAFHHSPEEPKKKNSVTGARGFLFHINQSDSRIRVIESTSQCCSVTISFPQEWSSHLSMSIVHSS
ncbi:hypothetical protein Pelo_590 [Pelomyxa schiedti]|nr:hypothetical protein Pelo_590 [Pelomyxa schiedti]